MIDQAKPVIIKSPLLDGYRDQITHGFFGRTGGVSGTIYQSLNTAFGSQDERAHISENRRRVMAYLGLNHAHLITAQQIHSPKSAIITADNLDQIHQVDGLVSPSPNIALGILTADCGPLLFYAPKTGIIGAAHAGWKGALGGIIEDVVANMIKLGAKPCDIVASLGPCISAEHYQVDHEFRARFLHHDPDYARFFTPDQKNAGFYYFDLWRFISHRLERIEIKHDLAAICTYDQARSFYSYRRSTHLKQADFGRQIAVICRRDI